MAGTGIERVSFTNPYSAEEADIERKRQIAEALQLQSQQPLGPTEMVGGWAVKKSPFEGAGKVAQALAAGYGIDNAKTEQKALSDKYAADLATALTSANDAQTGRAAIPAPADELGGGPGAPAQAPDRQALIKALMSHPATQPLAMTQIGKDLDAADRKRKLQDALGLASSAAGSNPMAPGASGSSVMAGSGTTAPAGGPAANPMAGMPPQIVALMTSGDPELVKLGTSLMEANKGIAQRPGAPVVNPFTGAVIAQPTPAVIPGVNLNVGPGGPTASVVPGYAGAQAALGHMPMTQVTNADQTHSYIPNSQLAGAATANPIPGVPPQAPPLAPPSPAARPSTATPSPAGFPRETPQQYTAAMQGRMGILQRELETEQAKLADPKTLPQDREISTSNIAALQKEIAGTRMNRGGAPIGAAPAAAAPAGPPRFGQTQEEQIRQSRETAAGKAVDEQFAKDYVQFTTGGGADATKQLAQLKDVKAALAGPGARLTGPMLGTLPDTALKFNATGRNAIAMRERVEEVVQRSLRTILGAQFTEKEGERLIARAYNPSLSESENAIRVGRLYTQLESALKSKQDAAAYFQKNNTLEGWKGKLPSMSDFDPDALRAADKLGAPVPFRLSPSAEKFYRDNGLKLPE